MVDPKKIKVVILGQDPTPQAGKATGLAFSVADPLSVGTVLNVLLEVALEGWSVNIDNGDLNKWAAQGVLLLNTALTVQQRRAGSHLRRWKPFTEFLVKYISDDAQPSVWFLWGKKAHEYQKLINNRKHYVITGGHPSTFGGLKVPNTFFAGEYFDCANQFLTRRGREKIDWGLVVDNYQKLPVANVMSLCPPEPM